MVSPIELYNSKVEHRDISDDKLQRRVINYLQGNHLYHDHHHNHQQQHMIINVNA
jgi:hypothetical protein